jgi:hypothetical protein
MADIRVSFVIPVRNDALRLSRCLATIVANDYPADAVEIVVADNGSTDESVDVARRAGARVLSLPGLSVAELRNRAAAVATGAVLAFVDADHLIASGWIRAASEAFNDRDIGAVGALCHPPRPGSWVQQMYGALRGSTVGRSDVEWLGAGNMAVSRQAFDAVHGFDDSLRTCEDVDLCQRLRALGWRIVGDERLANIHFGDPATLRGLFRSERWRGQDNLRVTFRGPWTLRSLPSAIAPILVGAACLGIVAGLFLSFAYRLGPLYLAGASALVVVSLSSIRTARMAVSAHLRSPRALAQAWIVALTYDLGRAAAILAQAPHHRRNPRPSVSARPA